MMKCFLRAALSVAVLLTAWGVSAGNWSDAEYQTVYRLLDACNTKQTLANATAMTLKMQLQANPKMAQFRPVFEAFIEKYMGYDAIKKPLAEAYLATFTQAELQEMIAFFETPTGKKMAANQSKLFQRGAEIGQAQVQAHLPELQMAIMQEVQKQQKASHKTKKTK